MAATLGAEQEITDPKPALYKPVAWAASHPALSLWTWCALLACLFFAYPLLNGLVLAPTDILYQYQPWQGLVPGSFQVQNPLLGDTITAYIPWWTEARRLLGEGRLPIWTPRAFLGMPLFANLQSGLLFPPNWPAILLPPVPGLALAAVLKFTLAGAGMGLWMRALRMSLPVSALAAAAFMFCAPVVVWAQAPISSVFICLPWVLWALDSWFATGRILSPWVAALALSIGLQFLGGHPETSFNLLIVVALYAFIAITLAGELGKSLRNRVLGIVVFGLSAMLGAGVAAVQILPFAILLPKSGQWWTRSYFGANHIALPLSYLQGWLFPNFAGNPLHHNYIDGPLNYSEQSAYVGVLMLIAAPLAWIKRAWRMYFWSGLAVLSVGFAYDMPGFRLIHELPLFRVSNSLRWQAIAAFAVITLGAMGLQALRGSGIGDRRSGVRALWPAVTLSAVGIVAGGLLMAAQGGYSTSDRHVYLGAWALWALFLGCLAGALLLVATRMSRNGHGLWWAAITLLLLADLWTFGISYNTSVPSKDYYPQTELTTYLQTLPPEQPVIAEGSDLFPSSALAYNIHDFRTLDDSVNHRFTFFIMDASVETARNPVWSSFGLVGRPNAAMLSQVGVKYFASNPSLDPNRGQPKGSRGRPYKRIWQGRTGCAVWENKYAVPYAYIAQHVEIAHDEHAARARLRKLKYADAGQVTILEATEGALPNKPAGQADITRVSRQAGDVAVDISVKGPQPAVLVINESLEAGWKARIDDQSATIHPANYIAQAVVVPQGTHRVTLHYMPLALKASAVASIVSLAICLLIFVLPRFGHFLARRRT